MFRGATTMWLLAAALWMTGCQKPTDPSSTDTFDKSVDAMVTPNPILAGPSTDGRTYRVVRGNNQPDEILTFDWHTVFSTTVTFNSTATSDDVDVSFPVKLTAASLAVKQASAGIVTPPTGGETEKYDFVVLNSSSNQVSSVGGSITTTYEVWYDLPSLRKEAVIELTYSFQDKDGKTYQKIADFTVAP
jgi:hypothetical protein